jgi:S-adenosylmethionine-diacylglycerol 3-amino-3-carboxypropyl transferase
LSDIATAVRRHTTSNLKTAVHRNAGLSREGAMERLFTFAFRGLVYAQIWEDPVVDMDALSIRPGDHIVAIASGGCNVMSYLTAGPAKITAVDLNGAHIALLRLKLEAARTLPGHRAFYRFFGEADRHDNLDLYESHIQSGLDATSRRYWEQRGLTGRKRISGFAKGFYRNGLLGNFIGAAHLLTRLHGRDPKRILSATSRAEQRRLFDEHYAPVLDSRFMRWLVSNPASLYGLGIPPAQYRALAGEEGIVAVLKSRLETLCCDFDIADNYFAWQAFGRRYEKSDNPSVPPYLQARNFAAVRSRANRVTPRHESMTQFLANSSSASADCYVLLDAQDWMNDETLTGLWEEITRTARPGARVIFRTAADERLLPGRLPERILSRWTYEEARSRALGARDRSSIYGAFHLYTLRGA